MNKMHFASVGLESFQIQASSIPNQYPFVALVTYAGRLSDGMVGGTEAIEGGPYQVKIPASLLRAKAKDLRGKGVFANSDLDSHDNSTQIGEFVDCWVESVDGEAGDVALALKASGLIYRDRNPDLVDEVITQARSQKLGFSYDLKDVKFSIQGQQSDKVKAFLELSGFQWRGATVLYREVAAYQFTQLAAAAKVQEQKEKSKMDKAELEAMLKPISDSVVKLAAEVAEIKKAAPPAPNPNPQLQAASAGARTSVSELAAAIGEQFKTALTPVIAALDEVKKGQTTSSDGKGKRLTLSAADIQFLSRFEVKDTEAITSQTYSDIIHKIHGDVAMPRSQKENLLSIAGSRKRELLRAEMRSGGGGQ